MLSSWIDGEGPDDLLGAHHGEYLREAADEIERLRKQIRSKSAEIRALQARRLQK
jgi:hypothetical protein